MSAAHAPGDPVTGYWEGLGGSASKPGSGSRFSRGCGGLHLRGRSGTGCCGFWAMPETISPLTANPRELSFHNPPTPDPAFKFHPENSSPLGGDELMGNVPLHPRTRKGGRVMSQSSSAPLLPHRCPPPQTQVHSLLLG